MEKSRIPMYKLENFVPDVLSNEAQAGKGVMSITGLIILDARNFV